MEVRSNRFDFKPRGSTRVPQRKNPDARCGLRAGEVRGGQTKCRSLTAEREAERPTPGGAGRWGEKFMGLSSQRFRPRAGTRSEPINPGATRGGLALSQPTRSERAREAPASIQAQ